MMMKVESWYFIIVGVLPFRQGHIDNILYTLEFIEDLTFDTWRMRPIMRIGSTLILM